MEAVRLSLPLSWQRPLSTDMLANMSMHSGRVAQTTSESTSSFLYIVFKK